MSIVPLIHSFTSTLSELLYHIFHFLSQLLPKRCGDNFAGAAAAAAATGAVLCFGVLRAFPLVALLNDAPLQCQMHLCFVARLEPTQMRWKSDHVCTTVPKTNETSVHECNSDKSTCNPTEILQEIKRCLSCVPFRIGFMSGWHGSAFSRASWMVQLRDLDSFGTVSNDSGLQKRAKTNRQHRNHHDGGHDTVGRSTEPSTLCSHQHCKKTQPTQTLTSTQVSTHAWQESHCTLSKTAKALVHRGQKFFIAALGKQSNTETQPLMAS